jgi:hypothetical protein
LIEGTLRLNATIIEDDNEIGTAKCELTMRDHQAGRRLRRLKKALPEQLFGFNIQRAGEIVKDE